MINNPVLKVILILFVDKRSKRAHAAIIMGNKKTALEDAMQDAITIATANIHSLIPLVSRHNK